MNRLIANPNNQVNFQIKQLDKRRFATNLSHDIGGFAFHIKVNITAARAVVSARAKQPDRSSRAKLIGNNVQSLSGLNLRNPHHPPNSGDFISDKQIMLILIAFINIIMFNIFFNVSNLILGISQNYDLWITNAFDNPFFNQNLSFSMEAKGLDESYLAISSHINAVIFFAHACRNAKNESARACVMQFWYVLTSSS